MHDSNDKWEYIVVHVDDFIVAMKEPQKFFDDLQGHNVGCTMKGIGKSNYHLGADFFHDDDGTLCFGAQTYFKRLCANFGSLYGEQLKSVFSPLNHEDHPKLNDSPICGPDDTAKFQSLIDTC